MKIRFALIATALLASGHALADCPAPNNAVQVPDGATATRDDMIAAQKAVKAYDTAVREYSECMGAGGAARAAEQIDRLKKVADRFNAELRVFKEKNAS